MSAKECLERIRRCDTKLEMLAEIRQELRERATLVTPTVSQDGVPGRKRSDRISYAAIEMADLEREIDRAMCRYARQMRKTIAMIDKLDNPDHIRLLTMRYIQHTPFEQIAQAMGRSVQGIFYMHGRALEAFEQVMNRPDYEKEEDGTP